MDRKGFSAVIIILIVVIVLAVAGGMWFYSFHPKISLAPAAGVSVISSSTANQIPAPSSVSTSQASALSSTFGKPGDLYYADVDTGRISVFSSQTGTKSTFVGVPSTTNSSYAVFDDSGRYLFFDDSNDEVYAYDFLNNELLPLMTGDTITQIESISPDGHYIIVDTGTGPGIRGRTVVDVPTQKIVFAGAGESGIWSPDSSQFAMAQPAIDLIATGADEYTYSIYIGSIQNNTTTLTLLLQGTPAASYEPLLWTSSSTFIYEETTFNEPIPTPTEIGSDWDWQHWSNVFENGIENYYTINVNTLVSTLVQAPSLPTQHWEADKPSPSGVWDMKYADIGQSVIATTTVANMDNGSVVWIDHTYMGDGASWRPLSEP